MIISVNRNDIGENAIWAFDERDIYLLHFCKLSLIHNGKKYLIQCWEKLMGTQSHDDCLREAQSILLKPPVAQWLKIPALGEDH